jgi:hypothetical protein
LNGWAAKPHKNRLDLIEKVFSFWERAMLALLSGQNEKTSFEAA